MGMGSFSFASNLEERSSRLEADFDIFFLQQCVDQSNAVYAGMESEHNALITSSNDTLGILADIINAAAKIIGPLKEELSHGKTTEQTTELNIALAENELAYHQAYVAFHTYELGMLKRVRNSRAALDTSFENINQAIFQYGQWDANQGPEKFSEALVDLLVDARSSGSDIILQRVRSLRRRLAHYYRDIALETGSESIVVEVLVGDEPCYLLVDTGAELVTLSPPMLTALGWDNLPSTEHEFHLAGGKKTRGQLVSLPEIAFDGLTVKEVSAAVLSSGHPGHDGLLGMSYLGQFLIRIDSQDEKPLQLKIK